MKIVSLFQSASSNEAMNFCNIFKNSFMSTHYIQAFRSTDIQLITKYTTNTV